MKGKTIVKSILKTKIKRKASSYTSNAYYVSVRKQPLTRNPKSDAKLILTKT